MADRLTPMRQGIFYSYLERVPDNTGSRNSLSVLGTAFVVNPLGAFSKLALFGTQVTIYTTFRDLMQLSLYSGRKHDFAEH